MTMMLTLGNLVVAAAIACFTFQTWRSTHRYARMAGISMILDQFNYVLTAQGAGALHRAATECIKIVIQEEFPELYERFEPHLSADLKKENRQSD